MLLTRLGTYLARLGAMLRHLGAYLARLGAILHPFWPERPLQEPLKTELPKCAKYTLFQGIFNIFASLRLSNCQRKLT